MTKRNLDIKSTFSSSRNFSFFFNLVFAGVCSILISLVLPETYVPYLLYQEAKRLRKETGDDRYHSALEDSSTNESPKDILKRTIGKPFIMIVQEPMLAVITLLMSFVYGIVYLLFEAIVRTIPWLGSFRRSTHTFPLSCPLSNVAYYLHCGAPPQCWRSWFGLLDATSRRKYSCPAIYFLVRPSPTFRFLILCEPSTDT